MRAVHMQLNARMDEVVAVNGQVRARLNVLEVNLANVGTEANRAAPHAAATVQMAADAQTAARAAQAAAQAAGTQAPSGSGHAQLAQDKLLVPLKQLMPVPLGDGNSWRTWKEDVEDYVDAVDEGLKDLLKQGARVAVAGG